MSLFNKNKKRIVFCGLVVLSLICYVAFAAVPGSEDDPLVSQSYIEGTVIPQVIEYIDNAVEGVKDEIGGTNESAEQKFEVVSVQNGQVFIGAGGTELILRMGSANIISTEKGGIADVTIGTDLKNGENMPANHLLIIPVSDGRGFSATGDILVMVKGSYDIQ